METELDKLMPLSTIKHKLEILNVRNLTDTDIGEVSQYIRAQIPQSILPQLFLLTEDIIKKAKIFVNIFRMVSAARDYVGSTKTTETLDNILNEVKFIYNEVYPLVVEYDTEDLNYAKIDIVDELKTKVLKYNPKINIFCNIFLVFAEKQDLIPIETVSGIKLEVEEGKNLYNEIRKVMMS